MLIVIEGIDGSGKGTQAAFLMDKLKAEGRDVHLFSFPRYTATLGGAAVGDYLNGVFGSLDRVHPQLASLLYALDRYESKPELEAQLRVRDAVVCDRYTLSNVAHQCARVEYELGESGLMLADWLDKLERQIFGLPKADLMLHLDLSVEAAQTLIAKKKERSYTDKAADLHEVDAKYLAWVREWYNRIARSRRDQFAYNWRTIPVERGGRLREPEVVFQDVWQIVSSYAPFL